MRTALEVAVSQSANSTIDDLTRSRLILIESQQAELGARIAGLEGIVFALKQQVTDVQRQLREILKSTHGIGNCAGTSGRTGD
jgi:uncharacterized coiled-coil protein SlyX